MIDPAVFRSRLSFLIVVLFSSVFSLDARELDVPYVPTPYIVVDHMLEMADVGPGDYVIDLGSGDGRIVITAVLRGANGHGVEIDPERIREARDNARREHVPKRVMFLEEDIFETDFSRATVVTMYLLPTINIRLRQKLLNTLEPGSRLVSHNFDMDEWKPDNRKSIKVRERNHNIYFWVIPADVEGKWTSLIDGAEIGIDIEQRFQEIEVQLSTDEDLYWHIDNEILQGKRIGFIASASHLRYIFSGRAEGGEINGIVQIYDGKNYRLSPWHARLNPESSP